MKTKKLKAIELFAGIGGFRIATDKLDIETVWANDFDPKACKVYKDNFGDIIEGDIKSLIDEVPAHDILTAGFPCQPFSSAGKKNGIQDPRGTLFYSIAQILNRRKPKYFILENVRRLVEMDKGSQFATILKTISDEGYQIEWRILNAANYGLAQNRYRILIVGVRTDELNKPILDENTSKIEQRSFFENDSQNGWLEIGNHSHKFMSWGIAYKGKYITKNLPEPKVRKKTLDEVLEVNVDSKYFYTESTLLRLKDSVKVDKLVNDVHVLYNQKGGARMGYTIFGTKGRAPTLTASTSRHYERYKIGDGFRRLTANEYARLQGFPDNHAKAIPEYDQYKYYGNAVPPVLVEYCLTQLLKYYK